MGILRSVTKLLIFALLLSASIFPVFSSGDVDTSEVAVSDVAEDNAQEFENSVLGSAAGVEAIHFFVTNPEKVIPAGHETEVLVGLSNNGKSSLTVHAIKATLHLPFDHRLLVQNLTVQEFTRSTVPPSVQATFPYSFTVSKFLQPGLFTLSGIVFYEVDEKIHQTVFYNGTIEIVEAMGLFNGETLSLVALALAIVGVSGVWINGLLQKISKKNKKVNKKVEVGTRSADITNEWLQGTAYAAQHLKSLGQQKSKKKK